MRSSTSKERVMMVVVVVVVAVVDVEVVGYLVDLVVDWSSPERV